MDSGFTTPAPALPAEGYVSTETLIGVSQVSAEKAAHNRATGRKQPLKPRAARPGILPFSRATLWRRVADGSFPKPVKLGAITAWNVDDVRRWLKAQGKEAH